MILLSEIICCIRDSFGMGKIRIQISVRYLPLAYLVGVPPGDLSLIQISLFSYMAFGKILEINGQQ